MLFTKVKVPSLNVQPDQTVRMHLWSNFIHFSKYRFLCHLCFCWAMSRKKLQIARIVNWDSIPRYLSNLIRACAVCWSKILPFVCQFLHKISSTPTRWFDSSNAIIDFLCCGSISVGCSSTHVQIVQTCLPGMSNGKTYTLYAFYYMK